MPLSERIYRCENCGMTCDRDLNAARNLVAMAGSLPVSACGLDSADTPRMKREENISSIQPCLDLGDFG
jgi:putative transposase